MTALYNEIDSYAARWMDNLIAANHVAPGRVDTRSIVDLKPEDVRDATQAHFFAGIAVWSAALRAAGWPDDVPIWTGSCPCQPFSQAGRGAGVEDERHLWPEWFRLICECRPALVVGEQVASPAGLGWLDAVFADMEGAGYACAAVDFCAASVGAPHMRQRIYFMAYADEARRGEFGKRGVRGDGNASRRHDADGRSANGGHCGCEGGDYCTNAGCDYAIARELADAMPTGRTEGRSWTGNGSPSWGGGAIKLLADTEEERRGPGRRSSAHGRPTLEPVGLGSHDGAMANADEPHALHGRQPGSWRLVQPAPHATAGFWSPADWIPCSDGKARPVEPGTFPLAHGATARVGRLRAYGNSIVKPQATAFIKAVMATLAEVQP